MDLMHLLGTDLNIGLIGSAYVLLVSFSDFIDVVQFRLLFFFKLESPFFKQI